MDETNSDTAWKWNIVLKEIEKKFETSYTVSNERMIKACPNDLNGIEAAQHNAEREARGRQRKPRYSDYSLKRLRPRYLQRKAQEYLIENPNAMWNDSSTRIIQRDVSFQVFFVFMNDKKETKAQIATLGQEMKNSRSELREH